MNNSARKKQVFDTTLVHVKRWCKETEFLGENSVNIYVDLEAELPIAAEKGGRKIGHVSNFLKN